MYVDSRSEASLSVVADIPLGYLRKMVSEIRTKSYSKESWKSWYRRTGSGRLVRQASVAACILNEMIYGLSDQAIDAFSKMFHMPSIRWEEVDGNTMVDDYSMQQGRVGHTGPDESVWRFCQKDGRSHLIDCIGSVLHEYLSSEIWDLPSSKQDFVELSDIEDGDITLHFFHDNAMMHQERYIFLHLVAFIFPFITSKCKMNLFVKLKLCFFSETGCYRRDRNI